MNFASSIKHSFIYELLLPLYNQKELYDWKHRNHLPPTPNIVKQRVVRKFARECNIHTFIETGTYMGTTLNAVKNEFKKIYSIEIDKILYERAKKKFSNEKHIKLLLGDSKDVLPKLIPDLKNPTLYWLDAHFSGGVTTKGEYITPIEFELKSILKRGETRDVILIDDADLFVGKQDYPSLKTLKKMCKDYWKNCTVTEQDNIIRIYNDTP